MLLQFLPVLASKKQTTLVLIDSHHSLTIGSKQTGRNAFGAGETQNLLGAARIPHAHYPFTPEANLLLSGENARALIDSGCAEGDLPGPRWRPTKPGIT